MNDNSKTLVALLAGLAAGTALGILFAPEKGEETRDNLSRSLKELSDTVKERASEELGALNSFTEKIITTIRTNVLGAEVEVEHHVDANEHTD